MGKIAMIRSGGQSGADRAALDTARKYDIPVCGWCPRGGWVEDYPDPPGILKLYAELQETDSADTAQRTLLNVRDSDATLIIAPSGSELSEGTELTEQEARRLGKPILKISSREEAADVTAWLEEMDDGIILNVAGPRASECAEAYDITAAVLSAVFEAELRPVLL